MTSSASKSAMEPMTDPLAVRIRHYQEERLLSADMQDGYDVARKASALHVVGLHDTWGIALGLQLSNAFLPWDDPITVGPGLAYDARGYPLWVRSERSVPSPRRVYPGAAPGSTFELVLFDGSGPCVPPESRDDALDLHCGEAPARERPRLAWRPANQVRLGQEVPLGRWRAIGDNTAAIDASVRPYARSQARAHVGAGTTPPEQLWEIWYEVYPPGNVAQLGVQTRVDTKSGGFASKPTYLAGLTLPVLDDPTRPALMTELGLRNLRFDVSEATAESFLFCLFDRSPAQLAGAPSSPRIVLPLRVTWIGVEPAGGMPPSADEFRGKSVRCCDPRDVERKDPTPPVQDLPPY